MRRLLLTALLLATVSLLVGCKTNEPTNKSARPWNAPKGWENGLPVGLTEGR